MSPPSLMHTNIDLEIQIRDFYTKKKQGKENVQHPYSISIIAKKKRNEQTKKKI